MSFHFFFVPVKFLSNNRWCGLSKIDFSSSVSTEKSLTWKRCIAQEKGRLEIENGNDRRNMKNHQDIKLYVYKIDIFNTKALKKFICKLFNLLWWFVVVPLTKCSFKYLCRIFIMCAYFLILPKWNSRYSHEKMKIFYIISFFY